MLSTAIALACLPLAFAGRPTAYLVESLPVGATAIQPIPGTGSTAETLTRLVQNTNNTLDMTTMYWELLAQVQPPCVPHQYCPDSAGFSEAQLEAFGSQKGSGLYNAIVDAAARGVQIRIIQAPGFGPDGNPESLALAENFTNVQIQTIQMEDWYQGGIMHQKVWVFDGLAGYIGSANQDWKSLTQVKELGIAFESAPSVVATLQEHFDVWWKFTSLNGSTYSVSVFDRKYNVQRQVPCWSPLADSCPNPLQSAMPSETQANVDGPASTELNGGGDYYMSCSPPETCINNRTEDETALVRTILDAKKTVSISVMDWVPATLYSNTPIYWNALVNAVTLVVNTAGVNVRLLVSKWAHTSDIMEPYLKALDSLASACEADFYNPCNGTLQIKYFEVPGWDSTEVPERDYPGHSRVNHAKYIVSDQRANIGTSNMVWGYFHNTAGASFNLNHPPLVATLQAIFDRDWASEYATPL